MRSVVRTVQLIAAFGLIGLAVWAPATRVSRAARHDLMNRLGAPGGLRGYASWYGGGERLNPFNAMNRRVNPEALEAAMWGVPLGTVARITSLENQRSVVVRITDHGPAWRFGGRIIDLSRRAFQELAPLHRGLVPVVIERVR